MRHGRALLLGLLNVLLVGCVAGGPAHSTSGFQRPALLQSSSGPDTIVLYVALIERPVGDRYLNQELWNLADEQAVDVERRAVLEENGFRVAQVGGIIPSGLQGLLSSERSCLNPHCVQLHGGQSAPLSLGPDRQRCPFEIRANGQETSVALEQARFFLVVKPERDRDGRTRLHFTPQVQHGEALLVPRPAADPSGVYNWELHEERPTENYDALAWEVVLAPNEYVIVGARYERPDTLGHCCFIDKEPPHPAQRLLVIRTGRPAEPADMAAVSADAEEDFPKE